MARMSSDRPGGMAALATGEPRGRDEREPLDEALSSQLVGRAGREVLVARRSWVRSRPRMDVSVVVRLGVGLPGMPGDACGRDSPAPSRSSESDGARSSDGIRRGGGGGRAVAAELGEVDDAAEDLEKTASNTSYWSCELSSVVLPRAFSQGVRARDRRASRPARTASCAPG